MGLCHVCLVQFKGSKTSPYSLFSLSRILIERIARRSFRIYTSTKATLPATKMPTNSLELAELFGVREKVTTDSPWMPLHSWWRCILTVYRLSWLLVEAPVWARVSNVESCTAIERTKLIEFAKTSYCTRILQQWCQGLHHGPSRWSLGEDGPGAQGNYHFASWTSDSVSVNFPFSSIIV